MNALFSWDVWDCGDLGEGSHSTTRKERHGDPKNTCCEDSYPDFRLQKVFDAAMFAVDLKSFSKGSVVPIL